MTTKIPWSLLWTLAVAGCTISPLVAEPDEERSGGAGTVFDATRAAFGHPLPMLARDDERAFFRGRALFRDDWVAAPSSTDSRDGLGPVFNARSCEGCHVRDGRGRPPVQADEPLGSLLLRLGMPDGGPEPTYGDQFQPLSIPGVPAEGKALVTYSERAGSYGDGSAYALRQPQYSFVELGFGPMSPEVLVSPRVAPAMIGLGLLEAVPEATLRELADPMDSDGDGISGRVNEVPLLETGKLAVGRFGWKANQPTVRQQSAGAFLGDIGLTSALLPSESCTAAQVACAAAASGGEPELQTAILDDVTFYSLALAVPARREWERPEVLAGKAMFQDIGCADCHIATLRTGAYAALPELAEQTIHPYTDLLLHDMGPALADGRADHLATGSEWRTPPLWGLGLQQAVNEHLFLLHDGRARGLAEAILWHGGEAEAAREAFRLASAEERATLIEFLESL